MAQREVDVLLPVFNGEAYIRSSIESIQRQSLANIGIQVVDDGSTDTTPSILAELAAADSRIGIHTQPNAGIVDALNAGLARCTAEFIARHDADDLALPTRLATQVGLLRGRPEVVATGGSARHIDRQGVFLGTFARFPPPSEADPRAVPAKEPYLLHPFLMGRRDAIAKVGGYRHVVHAEDTDLYWRLQELGELVSDQTVLGDYRMHAGSISGGSIRNGRIMAISTQLCALSALRRRSGKIDLEFTREQADELKRASTSLDALCAVVDDCLTGEELLRLRLAMGIKLLEFASYRPYELELADCVFVRRAFEEAGRTETGLNADMVKRTVSGTAARLLTKGLRVEAQTLLQPGMRLAFLARLTMRKFLPEGLHKRLRTAAGRS